MLDRARALKSFAASIDQDTVVLLGMGGSSLGPAVLAAVRDNLGGLSGRRVVVCDTTDPSTVADLPLEDAFVVVSSKSGTTLEPNVLFGYARSRVRRSVPLRGRHRSRHSARPRGRGARYPARVRERARHRRPVLGALALRARPGRFDGL